MSPADGTMAGMDPVLPASVEADLAAAAALLMQGRLVGLPTETVYGLAADARNPDAVQAIFALKQRPADHPLIVHIGTLEELKLGCDEAYESLQNARDAMSRLV